jgi:hypothetical protein
MTVGTGAGQNVRRVQIDAGGEPVTSPGEPELLRHVDAEGMYVTSATRPEVLFFRSHDSGEATILAESAALAEASPALHWTFGQSGFYYVTSGPQTAIRYFDIATMKARDVYVPQGGIIRTLTLSPDGQRLLFDLEHHDGFDVMLVDPIVGSMP